VLVPDRIYLYKEFNMTDHAKPITIEILNEEVNWGDLRITLPVLIAAAIIISITFLGAF
jgi:hypothetical protein